MWVLQTPGEKVDWHQDWTGWMEEGDTITDSDWSIEPSATLSDLSIDDAADLTTVWVADLELGKNYQLKNTITTDQGRIGVREITIKCAAQ